MNIINKTNNLKDIKSDATLRKIRSEKLAEFDRDKDDVLDIIKMQCDHDDIIKEVSFPFNVKLYSKNQFKVLRKVSAMNDVFFHFDATGTVVRHPFRERKKVLLYVGVINLNKSGRIFPVFSN